MSLIFWGADAHRLAQVRHAGAARRQPRRRRHHGADGAGAVVGQQGSRWYCPLLLIGVFGAALFYGDSVITPAISVLSAIEGPGSRHARRCKPYVVPLTIDRAGRAVRACSATARPASARWFGPIMVLWFAALAAWASSISSQRPQILAALNPLHALALHDATTG